MRYQSNRPKRQFLAGVTCSQCQALDTVVQVQVFEPEFDEYIECTQCGHIERRPKAGDLNHTHNTHNTHNVSTNDDGMTASQTDQNTPKIVNAGISVANITDRPTKKMHN